ncbi:MAG: ABC transporter substrate-binding protein [Pseudomonadota bacterium]
MVLSKSRLLSGMVLTASVAAAVGFGGQHLAYAQQQSPSLDAAVADGSLPPVEQRLPSNPLVIEPVEGIGQYGGTWRSALRGGADTGWIARTVAYDGLLRYDRDWANIVPNLVADWSVNEDATRYDFTLRDGLHWSNGEPFSTADIAFAVELLTNEDYAAGSAARFLRDDSNPVELEVVSDTEFAFIFENPAGLFPEELASVDGYTIASLPAAYCSQFHPDYNPDADALAQEEGFENWSFLMLERCAFQFEVARYSNPDLPVMTAWMVDSPLTGDAARLTFVRNPYYWKVDPEGNQLPYIDALSMRVSESAEEIMLAALNGEIDFQDRHIATVANRPIFFDGQEGGDYRMGQTVPSASVSMLFLFNMNHEDPVLRDLFRNRDFRIGFSHALDRQEIIDVVFTGQGQPFQPSPRPESPYYDEEMSTQFTQFDQDLAAQYLDAAGLSETNGSGIRLMEDGRPLAFEVEAIAAFRPEWIDMLELAQLQLREVGIDMQISTIDRSLFFDKNDTADFDVHVWQGDGGLDVVGAPRYYFPANQNSWWAMGWQSWYRDIDNDIAEEPPEWAREQMSLYDQLKTEPDPAVREDLMNQILDITQEEFPVVGVNLEPPGYYIARNNLHNVAPSMMHAWRFPTPAPYDPFQWYFE